MHLQLYKQVIGLAAKTESGILLGKVHDVEIDTNTHIVSAYFVKSRNPIEGLFKDSFVIGRESVLSLTDTLLLVSDSFVAEQQLEKKEQTRNRFVVSTPEALMEDTDGQF